MASNLSVKLAGQSAYFLTGSVFTLIVGFPFQIYLANCLGADGLGVFGLLEASISVAAGLLGFGLAPAAVKYIPHMLARSSSAAIRDLLRNGFKRLLLAGCGGYLVLLIGAPVAARFFSEIGTTLGLLPVMGLMLPLGLVLFFASQSLRGFHDIRYMVMGSSFLQLTVKVILTFLLFSLGYKLIGYIWAVVLSTLCALLWMMRGLNLHVQRLPGEDPAAGSGAVESWSRYAKVMYANSLLSTFTAPLDRYLVGFFVGASGVGVLMTVKMLQQLPVIFLQMFLAVVAPMFSAAKAEDDMGAIQRLYCLTTDWLMRLSLPLLVFLALFAGQVLALYGEVFRQEGILPLYILLFAQLVNLGCGPIGNVLNMAGLERQMFKISLFQTGITSILFVALTPYFGIIGAACAILAGIVISNVSALAIAKKNIAINWWDTRYRHWLLPVLSSILFCWWVTTCQEDIGILGLLLYLVGNYLVFTLVHLAVGISEDDRAVFRAVRDKIMPHRQSSSP